MLAALDPHSSYMEGSEFTSCGPQLTVIMAGLAVGDNGRWRSKGDHADRRHPAANAGIKAGDYITHLDGELLYGLTLDQAVENDARRVRAAKPQSPSFVPAATSRSTSL